MHAGVSVSLMQHAQEHGTPDAVFPNNWFSTHAAAEAAGATARRTMVLYPMKCPNRAAERRPELVQLLRQRGYEREVDLTGAEARGSDYFEGTGVLVLDRVRGVAYVSLSERASRAAAERCALEYACSTCVHARCRVRVSVHVRVVGCRGTVRPCACMPDAAHARVAWRGCRCPSACMCRMRARVPTAAVCAGGWTSWGTGSWSRLRVSTAQHSRCTIPM
jgi:N,N dimethylarginine dimethylhydrolase, eukaryotic